MVLDIDVSRFRMRMYNTVMTMITIVQAAPIPQVPCLLHVRPLLIMLSRVQPVICGLNGGTSHAVCFFLNDAILNHKYVLDFGRRVLWIEASNRLNLNNFSCCDDKIRTTLSICSLNIKRRYREASNPWEIGLELRYRSYIWQASH